MNTAWKKGNILEDVVEAVERFLLAQNPGILHHQLTIRRKKRVTVDEVLHEMDLYVEIDMGNGYAAIYIFECKNWEQNVDKNEIIVFSEKIKATNATKGFFIAKGFTSHANAQAKKDQRIELVIAAEDFGIFPFAFPVDSFNSDIKHIEMTVFEEDNEKALELNDEDLSTTLDGSQIELNSFVKIILDDFIQKKYGQADPNTPPEKQNGSALPTGTHRLHDYVILDFSIREFDEVKFGLPRWTTSETAFSKAIYSYKDFYVIGLSGMHLSINNHLIRKIQINVDHLLHLVPPVLIWHYDVEKRGRVAYYEYNTPIGILHAQITGQEGAPYSIIQVKRVDEP